MNDDQNAATAHVLERLDVHLSGARTTLELLADWRSQVERSPDLFESPHAVREYVDFFVASTSGASAECERIRAELPQAVERAHVTILRRIAADAGAQRPRCLLFRDKWINKPLPHESVRPLLNDISVTTRDQLTALAELDELAVSLESVMKAEPASTPEQKRSMDRRALFTRLFRG